MPGAIQQPSRRSSAMAQRLRNLFIDCVASRALRVGELPISHGIIMLSSQWQIATHFSFKGAVE
jgi:hypothetical protein